jgi:hypothetical protein
VRALFVVSGALFTLLVLGLGTFSLINRVSHLTDVTPVAFGTGIRSVAIRVDAGSITVRGGERPDVSGERSIERGLQAPNLEERVDGDTLRVDAGCAPTATAWCDVSYTLDVPTGTRVDVTSARGSLTVVSVTGEVRAHSTTGSIDLADSSGPAVLETSVGSVRGSRLRSTDVAATTTVGTVRLQFTEPPSRVAAHAGEGTVDIALPRGDTAYRVTNPTNRPNQSQIAVATDLESDHLIEVSSRSGAIRVHYT